MRESPLSKDFFGNRLYERPNVRTNDNAHLPISDLLAPSPGEIAWVLEYQSFKLSLKAHHIVYFITTRRASSTARLRISIGPFASKDQKTC